MEFLKKHSERRGALKSPPASRAPGASPMAGGGGSAAPRKKVGLNGFSAETLRMAGMGDKEIQEIAAELAEELAGGAR